MKNTIREAVVKYIGKKINSPSITSPEQIAEFIRSVIKDDEKEYVIALYLNGAHQITDYSIVSIGILNASYIHPREVFKPAIVLGACKIILAHNHPSGSLTPSKEDHEVTRIVKEAGNIIGIALLDHIIVTKDNYTSIMGN